MILSAAVTLDGKIASADRRKFDLGSREDRRRMARLRESAGVVIVGARTLRYEDPPPFIREQKRPGPRARRPFTWVILTRSLDLPVSLRVMRSDEVAKILVAPQEGAPAAAATPRPRQAASLLAGAAPCTEVWRLGRGEVDLARLLARLAARGFRRVVVEGGGEVNFGFLKAALVDEVWVTVCPYLLGGASAPTLADGEGLTPSAAVPLRLVRVERRRGEIFLRYRCRPRR